MIDGRVWVRSTRLVVAAVVTLAVCVGASACGGDQQRPATAGFPTTLPSRRPTDMMPTPAARPAAEIVGLLENAVRDRNFCSLLGAVDLQEPAVKPTAGVVDVYRALAGATAAARGFVPDELTTWWQAVIETTASVAKIVENNGGNRTDPDVDAAFNQEAFTDAMAVVERYEMTSCPAPSPTN